MGLFAGLCGDRFRAAVALGSDVAGFFCRLAPGQHLAALLHGALPGGALLHSI